MVVFGVGDGALQRLAHLDRDPLARELEIRKSPIHLLAANELGQKIELLGAHAKHAGDRLSLVVLERAGRLFLAHDQPLLAFLSAAWPWNVLVGENSPNL